ncbi:hypothetical protein KKE60_06465 [Patescibacteria group bacterium]|nr:hypothetical protein [Patescibacteria group bacterium]
MKVGIIAPISSLRKYCKTEIQYCIPSLIVSSKEYRNFYKEQEKTASLLILDTAKVGWKREPENFGVVEKALDYINPTLIITPSYMYNLNKTIEVVREFLTYFKPKMIAGCLEGTTEKEVQACSSKLKNLGIATKAIPAHILRITKEIVSNGPTIYIDNHLTIKELYGLEGVLVTSLPVRLGLQGRLLSDYMPSPPLLNFYEEDKFQEMIEKNIKELRNFYE